METAAEVRSDTQEDGPEQLIERVQDLQAALDGAADSPLSGLAEELVSAVVQMYGAGLEQIVARLFAAGEVGERMAVSLTDDPLVSTLLLIHDLHPVPLGDRVQAALDSVRPYMESHGGGVELLGLENGVARIFLQGSCSDCSASSVTLELAIKQALEEAAPDLEGLEVEGVAPQTVNYSGPPTHPQTTLPMITGSAPATGMELPVVIADPPAHPIAPAWFEVASVGELADGDVVPVAVQGLPLLIANVDGALLAYRDVCAACGGTMHDGALAAGALACRHCRRSFFLPRAGRSMDDDKIQLEPVPLLRADGRVKVALAA
jgi:Fe-S cluster biogenesis protein NfuA/nitrite reductase/ring-hydroxylating ferredoxin subunit